MATGALDPEAIDLADLTRMLADEVPVGARVESLAGRTAFRDATLDALGCSALEAEHLVDTLIARGFLVFEPGSPGVWRVRVDAS